MLRRLNDALPGLVAGILIWGVLLQAVGVWFISDRLSYSIGLWYGVVIAIGMAINMASVIYDSTFEDTGGGTNYRVVIKSILRYVIVVVLYAVLGFFGFGNIIAAFCGTMGLKISAYMQPLLMKLAVRMGLREPEPEYTEATNLPGEMNPQGESQICEDAECLQKAQETCEETEHSDDSSLDYGDRNKSTQQTENPFETEFSEAQINRQCPGDTAFYKNGEVEA